MSNLPNFSLGGVRLSFKRLPCKHSKTWLIAGGRIEWCYQCGAFRTLNELISGGSVVCSAWCSPSTDNPWDAWRKRTKAWKKASETRALKRRRNP